MPLKATGPEHDALDQWRVQACDADVFNEPESGLHPSLFELLARMIAAASKRSQIIVVGHAKALVEALAEQGRRCWRLRR